MVILEGDLAENSCLVDAEQQHPTFKREIKSYVLRSRMTASQRLSLEQLWSSYGINATSELSFEQLFQRQANTIIEIGFGMGGSLIQLAQKNPAINFIGIEVHRPGIGALLTAIHDHQLTNIRVICGDALAIFENCIPEASLHGVLLFFPDPWPKRRHHKRRIVQSEFVNLIHCKLLNEGGYFHLATDIIEYAKHMTQVINNHSGFTIMDEQYLINNNMLRPKTKFEQRGMRLGHTISDLIYCKK